MKKQREHSPCRSEAAEDCEKTISLGGGEGLVSGLKDDVSSLQIFWNVNICQACKWPAEKEGETNLEKKSDFDLFFNSDIIVIGTVILTKIDLQLCVCTDPCIYACVCVWV